MEFEIVKTEQKNITVKNKKGAREQKTVFRYKLESYTGDKATMTCEDDSYAYGDTLEIKKLRSQAKLTEEPKKAAKPRKAGA